MDGYYYELKMVDEDKGVLITHKFPAELTSEELRLELKDFLLGCGWHPETIYNIIAKGELDD